MSRVTAWLIVSGILFARIAHASQAGAPLAIPPSPATVTGPSELPLSFDGAPPPVPPAVVSRDESGRVTIRAVRLAEPLRVDGQLDEAAYANVPPISDFIQADPQHNAPATDRTDVWVMFDHEYVYVSFRCWESEPGRRVANEMRRDSNAIFGGDDVVSFIIDTFYDRRNDVQFVANALGGRMDGQSTNEKYSGDWNPIWEVNAGRFEQGWTVEAAIPFRSLRYRPGQAQIWGFNALRTTRWKNEISLLTRVPAGWGMHSLQALTMEATLVGLEAPAGGMNLDVKPYVISDLKSDRTATPRIANDVSGDFGVDVKYGVTQNVTADFTYNTDFAQVEADEQQVNLTRFSLFFPEKREFFLENQGLFAFPGSTRSLQTGGDTPIIFYSRRIGLNQGRVVPIEAGGRVTGRLGRVSFGALGIREGEESVSRSRPTGFSVVRLRRDILRRSSIGLMMTGRSVALSGVGSNTAYGVDGALSFFDNLNFNAYWARTRTTGLSGKDTSYQAQMDYNGDRYGAQLERLVVGDDFNPEVGFVRRDDMKRSSAQLRFSPRPRTIPSVRKLFWIGSMAYTENGAGRLETRDGEAEFTTEFQNSNRLSLVYNNTYEFLPRPFNIATGVTLPVGGYAYSNARLAFTIGPQRKISTLFAAEYGTFYNGHKTALSATRGRVNVSSHLSVEPTYSVNWIDLEQGRFTTHLVGSRLTFTMTPQMFASALLQYNSSGHAVMANLRLRWEYQPGSELFVVFNEERDARGTRFPDLANRAVIVKFNRLFRF